MIVCMDTSVLKERRVTSSNWEDVNFKLVGVQSCHGTTLLDLV